MSLEHKQPKRIATKGTKKVLHGPESGDKTQITLLHVRMLPGIHFSQWFVLRVKSLITNGQ